MRTVYSVIQINNYIKNMFANDYLMRNVQVTGELSNVKYHSSGHIYFTLKEGNSILKSVMFRNARMQGLDFMMQDGQKVVITGNIAVYDADGRYQLYAKQIVQEGHGDLYAEYERLKQKLYEEGLFDFEHKKPIPRFPHKVGIVTASTGAAIRDIQNIAARRNPYVQLYLYPAKVQGEGAAETIVKGIETLDRMGMDTIIVGRGGGSIEDLWAFNEECVARAIYAADTPIISGTGHEIDNTIADYVADLRAPTPSAACELAMADVVTMQQQLTQYEERMRQYMAARIRDYTMRLQILKNRLEQHSPTVRYHNQVQYLDSLTDRLNRAMDNRYRQACHRYELLLTGLHALSPTARLTGGFGYIAGKDGTAVRSVRALQEGDTFAVTVWDGTIQGVVTDIVEDGENRDA